MPYLNTPQDDEEKKKSLGSTQQVTSGVSGTVSGTQSGNQAPGAPTSSGSFVPLKKYLDANRGNSGAMATELASDLGGKADTAKGEFQQTSDEFGEQVGSNTFKADEGLLKSVRSGDFSTDKADEIARGYNASFDTQTYGKDAYSKAISEKENSLSNAYGAVQNTDDYYKRKTLLGDLYNKENPRYGGGLQALDSYLVTQDPESQSSLEALRSKYTGLTDYLDTTKTGVNSQIDAAQQATADAASAYREAVGEGAGKIETAAQKRAEAENAAREGQYYQALADTGSGIGFGAADIGDVDKTQFYSQGRKLSASDAISREEAARLAALARITGQSNYVQRSGREVDPAYTFNQEAYDAAVRAANQAQPVPAPVLPKDNSGKVVADTRNKFKF